MSFCPTAYNDKTKTLKIMDKGDHFLLQLLTFDRITQVGKTYCLCYDIDTNSIGVSLQLN